MTKNYSRQSKNKNPIFSPPSHHKQRPRPIRRWQNWAAEKELHLWTGFMLLRASGRRKRGFRPDRQAAMQAIAQACLHHLNLVTHQVEASIEMLSDECGLSTVSAANNKSICRTSRFFCEVLEPAGCVKLEKAWDKFAGQWIPTYIELLPRFFEMIGLDYSFVEKEQQKRLRYAQVHGEAGTQSITELKKLARLRHKEVTYKKRRERMQHAKRMRVAKRVDESKQAFGYAKLDGEIALDIIDHMNPSELKDLDPSKLKHMVNRHKRYLRQLLE